MLVSMEGYTQERDQDGAGRYYLLLLLLLRPDSVTRALLTVFGVGKLFWIKAVGISIMALVSSTTAGGGGSLPWCTYKAGRPLRTTGALLAPAADALPCHLPTRLGDAGPRAARDTKAMAGLVMWLHATTSPKRARTPRGTIICRRC